MPVINNAGVYDYYLSTYGQTSGRDRYDSHKRGELKEVYNRMVKTNKESPLYKIKFDNDVTEFAIDLKESARKMQNVVASLSTTDKGIESVFNKRIAVSSNPDAVDVEYIGSEDSDDASSSFTLGVESLASPQINEGRYLSAMGKDFQEGSYSFDLSTTAHSYEFQYNVSSRDTNRDVQSKISRLINTSDIGLRAQVVDRGDTSSLRITSRQTGLAENEDYLFKISSGESWNELQTLGIDKVTSPAASSKFTLNGQEHHSLSNTFTINKAFELTLKDVTPEGQPARIGFKANTEAIADSVDELLSSFNGFIAVGEKYSSSKGNNQLLNEVKGISRAFAQELSSVGIAPNEDGTLSLDREKIAAAVTGDDRDKAFVSLNKFKEAMSREANKTSVNPLNYVDKVTVEYKNPGKNFTAPYAQSVYSGLLVDQSL
ncbi:MAG: flagellar capping protein [Lachnospiraceae bacterium]|nr:flagellar capping protein [Lachnospiraceae bacterium]